MQQIINFLRKHGYVCFERNRALCINEDQQEIADLFNIRAIDIPKGIYPPDAIKILEENEELSININGTDYSNEKGRSQLSFMKMERLNFYLQKYDTKIYVYD